MTAFAASAALRRAALVQALLEGVELPAEKPALVAYARAQGDDPGAVSAVEALPERRYASLDEVGEAIAPVQPSRRTASPRLPRPESGLPPGGDDYTRIRPVPGQVQHSPASTSPHEQLERQTARLQEQKERRKQLG